MFKDTFVKIKIKQSQDFNISESINWKDKAVVPRDTRVDYAQIYHISLQWQHYVILIDKAIVNIWYNTQ